MFNETISFSIPALFINLRTLNMQKGHAYREAHYHNEVEIIKIKSGTISIDISGESFTLEEGKIIIINSRIIHRLMSNIENSVCTYLQVNIDKYSKLLMPTPQKMLNIFINKNAIKAYCVFDSKSELGQIFSEIENEAELKKKNYDIYIKSKIFNITALMCREDMLSPMNYDIDEKYIKKILPAIEYAEKKYSSKIYLDTLCKELNIDKFYFCKLFKKATGASFIDYLNFIRLYQAEKLLIKTDKNISEVSFECGFGSIQYFNRIFKTHKGCSPKDYRKFNNTNFI